MKQRNVTYGISKSIMEMYRLLYKLGDSSHDETMSKLKAWYDERKAFYKSTEGATQ